jgi:hypothetical protein
LSTLVVATILATVSISSFLPQSPNGEHLALGAKSAPATIFEWSDYGGTASTVKAKVTIESEREICEAFADPARASECADVRPDPTIYTAKANCQTGELWSLDGQKYLFDGKIDSSDDWDNGWIAFKDARTGSRVATNNAAGGKMLASHWLTLCPLGLPYDRLPVRSIVPGPETSGMGFYMVHNDSHMYFDQGFHTILYAEPKPSIARSVKPDSVLFRGWIILGGPMRGVAYTFKNGCPPAPYLVEGYDQGDGLLVLTGAAPIRKGCDVVGYTKKSSNAKLVFHLPPD